MTMPNFLIIGAAKAGTTSLHYYLAQHPDIYMSPRKDTFFFDFYGTPPDYSGPGDNAWYKDFAIIHLEDYQALFAGVTREKAIGEACAQYLYDAKAPERIRHAIPDAKLIAILRNPVDRAYSSFLQQVRDRFEQVDDFADALRLEAQRISDNWRPLWHYKTRGLYFAQLQRYLRLFDSSRLRIYLYEDLNHDPVPMLQDIFQFLEVDNQFMADISMRHNVAGIPRSRILRNLVMQPNLLKSVVKPLLPQKLRDFIKTSVTVGRANIRKPPLAPEVRQKLITEYRDDVFKLQELIGRDLSHWLI